MTAILRHTAISFMMLLLPVIGADVSPKGFTQMTSDESSSGSVQVIHYKKDTKAYDSESQIWVHSTKEEFKDQLLFTHYNRSSTLISDEGDYIAINHHELSGLGQLYIFMRNDKGGFEKVKLDFLATIKEQVKKELSLGDNALGFDHEYCYADRWMRDGLLLGHLRGNLSGETTLEEWYFIYDVRKNHFVSDLKMINKGTYSEKENGKWVPRK